MNNHFTEKDLEILVQILESIRKMKETVKDLHIRLDRIEQIDQLLNPST